MISIFISAISLGLLGSFHCVGMCGPIALALPIHNKSLLGKVWSIITYNLGRIVTYGLLGGLFGLIGESFVIAGFQQSLSIILGFIILLMVLLPNSIYSKFKITTYLYSHTNKLKNQLGILFKKNSLNALFFIGTLNGLLPCGLVYLGITGAIATGSSLNGFIFMTVFGLGTIPAMFTLSFFSNTISINFRNKIKKAIPVFITGMALLLILRGLNLGIPYISPELSHTKVECKKCCHK